MEDLDDMSESAYSHRIFMLQQELSESKELAWRRALQLDDMEKRAEQAERTLDAILTLYLSADSIPPEIQMAKSGHSVGVFKDGILIAADADVRNTK